MFIDHAYIRVAGVARFGVCGWGLYIEHGPDTHERYGGAIEGSQFRVELEAVLCGLALVPADAPVTVLWGTPNMLKTIQEWVPGWKARGWLKANKKPPEDADLWQELDRISAERRIEWALCPSEAAPKGLARRGLEEAEATAPSRASREFGF